MPVASQYQHGRVDACTYIFLLSGHVLPHLRDETEELVIGQTGVLVLELLTDFILEQEIGRGRTFGRVWVLGLLGAFCLAAVGVVCGLTLAPDWEERRESKGSVDRGLAIGDLLEVLRKSVCDICTIAHRLCECSEAADELEEGLNKNGRAAGSERTDLHSVVLELGNPLWKTGHLCVAAWRR